MLIMESIDANRREAIETPLQDYTAGNSDNGSPNFFVSNTHKHVYPPSITSVVPVMYLDASLAR